MELNGNMRHSAHSHTKQNQAGNKLPAVISFLRGILFSCIPCLITHTLLGSAAANPALPVLTAGQLQEMLLMENCRKERGAARWGLCQDPQPHCRTATAWANAWPKAVQESSELHLQHLLWKSHSSVHTGQVQQKLPQCSQSIFTLNDVFLRDTCKYLECWILDLRSSLPNLALFTEIYNKRKIRYLPLE